MSQAHLRPHFFIIGERKCGTSSLYRYLLSHPQVLPGPRKEMQFFTRGAEHVAEHFGAYLEEFPRDTGDASELLIWPELDASGALYETPLHFERKAGAEYVTGEASADTFCDVAPALLRRYLPEARLILLLRDPVARAFSHHRMYRRFQDEGRELGFSVGDFGSDMRRELHQLERGLEAPCLGPGLYLERLRAWQEEWGREAIAIVFTAELEDPECGQLVMGRLAQHLGLREHDFGPALAERYNKAPREAIPEDIAGELRDFYRPHDRALQAHLGLSVPWVSPVVG